MNTQEIQMEIRDGALRLSWDNQAVQKDTFAFLFMVVFWIVWAPITVCTTWLLFNGGPRIFLSIWLLFGWLGTLLIPYQLLGRFWSERIILAPEYVSFGAVGFLAPKPKTVFLENIREMTLGYCDDSSERESMVTLNIFETRKKWRGGRHMLGYWLAPDLKENLFQAIQSFVEAQKIPLKMRRYR